MSTRSGQPSLFRSPAPISVNPYGGGFVVSGTGVWNVPSPLPSAREFPVVAKSSFPSRLKSASVTAPVPVEPGVELLSVKVPLPLLR